MRYHASVRWVVIPSAARNLLSAPRFSSDAECATMPPSGGLSFRAQRGICFYDRDKRYYVYIMASKSRVLYIGISSSLYGRVMQHKRGELDGFTKRYNITRLVYFETFRYVNNAIARETELKKWRRAKKVALIERVNPTWEDFATDWGTPVQPLVTADSSLRSE